MGLVFFRNYNQKREPFIHKYPSIQHTAIEERAALPSTSNFTVRSNNKFIKTLSPENLLFLQNIGIFKKK